MADMVEAGLRSCDNSSCIVTTTMQIQPSLVGIRVHVYMALLDFISKISHVESKKTRTQYR